MSIHSPEVIRVARELGITDLQAYRHVKAKDELRRNRKLFVRYSERQPDLILQTRRA